jgi:hypothetical protein
VRTSDFTKIGNKELSRIFGPKNEATGIDEIT